MTLEVESFKLLLLAESASEVLRTDLRPVPHNCWGMGHGIKDMGWYLPRPWAKHILYAVSSLHAHVNIRHVRAHKRTCFHVSLVLSTMLPDLQYQLIAKRSRGRVQTGNCRVTVVKYRVNLGLLQSRCGGALISIWQKKKKKKSRVVMVGFPTARGVGMHIHRAPAPAPGLAGER